MIYDMGEPRLNMVTHIRISGVAKDARGGTRFLCQQCPRNHPCNFVNAIGLFFDRMDGCLRHAVIIISL